MNNAKLLVVMGVSGVGKTTVGSLLAEALTLPFIDADDFHPKENIEKMASGIPLNDDDRHDWLLALNEVLLKHKSTGAVLACSALKEKYRELLSNGIAKYVTFVFLEGTYAQLQERLQERKGHFMPAELLKSQLETLEPPKSAIKIAISYTSDEIVEQIIRQL